MFQNGRRSHTTMQLRHPSWICELMLFCLLLSAEGLVQPGGLGGILGENIDGGGLLGGSGISLVAPVQLQTLPFNNSGINSCSQLERNAVALTLTSASSVIVPYFIRLTFPSSARVGETFPIDVNAFSMFTASLPVRITLKQYPAYEILGSSERSICVPPNVEVKATFNVKPLQAGSTHISAQASVESFPGCSSKVRARPFEVTMPMKIEFPGIPKEKTFSQLLCSGDNIEEEESSVEWRLEVAGPSVIEGSVKAWVTVTGDLLGPTLDNIGDLIRMPYGCGEQNMITLTPNIYVMQYFEATNQLTNDIRTRLIANINAGYKRELNYKRPDGSYSAFGDRDASGSTWLTAFVVKSFAQSQDYIDVDPNEIAVSSNWLKNLQLPSGCFQSVGTLIHKGMQGGNGAPGALTAFVMIALLEAGESASSPAIVKGKACVDQATALGSDGANNFYLLALKAYAFNLAKFMDAQLTFGNLFLGMSLDTNGGVYWPMLGSNGKNNAALSIETTSYSLLALLTQYGHNFHPMNSQIAKWLSSKMNSHGGFVSTQDTVLALQALALYESLHPQQDLGLTVTVQGNSLDATFEITEVNNLEIQTANVDVIPNDIGVEVVGNGCALVQAVVSYSVENPQNSGGLGLQVGGSRGRALTCQSYIFSTCVSYNLRDTESNMAIIEITLVTGYTPEKNDLDSLVCGGRGNIKLYEVHGSKVIFYIERLTASQTCVEFRVSQETVVRNAKNGTIKVYDYYQPELFVSETFALGQFSCARPIA